jgi:hypothetical protein
MNNPTASLATLISMRVGIDNSINEINKFEVPDTVLIKDYNTLKADVEAVIKSIDTYTENTINKQFTDLGIRQRELDTRRLARMAHPQKKPFSLTGLFSDTFMEIKKNFKVITLFFGMFMGAVVASHIFITPVTNLAEASVSKMSVYTLFYGMYGAVLFPFTILYGLYSPPMWRAPLFPLIEEGNEPGWVNIFPISLIAALFKYSPPSINDTASNKLLMRIMCGIAVAFSVIAVTLEVK